MKTKIFGILFIYILGISLFFSARVTANTETSSQPETFTTVSTQSTGNRTKKPKVKSTIKKITLNKSVLRLNPKDKRTLKATYIDKKQEGVRWISKNSSVAKVNQKGIVTGKKKGTTYIYCISKSKKVKAKCKVIVGKFKYVAITFDDGPSPYTEKLVSSLKDYNSNCTFFVVGSYVSARKNLLKKSYYNGNEIGSHSYDHAQLTKLNTAGIKSEIDKTKKVVKDAIGIYPTVLRPPYGSFNDTVSKIVDVPMIYWSVDTLDWKYRNVDYVYKEIMKTVGDGEIILLHDSHPTSVDGFLKALPKLRKKGYELVTVSELFKLKGKKMKKGTMYYSCY